MFLGMHVSASAGFLHMGKEALSVGANTFQFFTRNPRGGKAKTLDPQDAAALCSFLQENHFGPIVAHAPYTMNACAAKPEVRDFAFRAMKDDLSRMEYLPGNYYNFHPGSHVGQGVETGIQKITGVLNTVLTPEQHTTVLLETMAGKGTEVGRSFEELRAILDGVQLTDKVGVCLDTCHVYDAGYDIVNDLDGVLETFDRVIGLQRLKAVHLNDSKNPYASHKDRHESIGNGSLGLAALVRVLTHPALCGLPFILETPQDTAGHGKEIALLRAAVYAKKE
ncbi:MULTISPECIES: deoxyribonuclease IV [Caproicibacterium]|uniref:Probable endonuclease 4 n=1 Tax=Caproicibacterium lactatifermentans TaxID=2666138 RepID=A0A859DVH4_9FIRM|nr:deoxyribonuclease IV [Caproicibacterium lactatifermentans]ARP49947.1 endonuclease IV [Ruminococcaceae bacterium CPB6]MDD4807679.1 deoxyribonuclease IV [Oscillospiraceae bacterium]QKN24333.1 deoxyribonuclease IV [Caproicibacterium lactatifermentans]QKO30654.1 deoxyribonuclease IV [Caproicibacterium lactatifermentans]